MPSHIISDQLRMRAETLAEALPYLQQFYGSSVVIKYGGSAMLEASLKESVLQDVVLLRLVGMSPVVVHGGGPEISGMMKRLGLEPTFVDGLRVTDGPTMEVVEMVLVGRTNGEIVGALNRLGAAAVGLSGKDANLLVARKLQSAVDLGQVGEVERVNPQIVQSLINQGYVPVVAPVAAGEDGTSYNINADTAAGKLAAALGARKLILLSDVRGVMTDKDDPASLVSTLDAAQARRMIEAGQVESGMIPKVEACIQAVQEGVEKCHIIDGRLPHALLMEILTAVGIGTMITA